MTWSFWVHDHSQGVAEENATLLTLSGRSSAGRVTAVPAGATADAEFLTSQTVQAGA
ncbi:hypothetical protein DSECCO2_464230 [anaerobic digester metagenome]